MKEGIIIITTCLVAQVSALAAPKDITINDSRPLSQYGSDPRGINESGFVSANSVANNSWDLKILGFDGATHTLSYVGGFNPVTGNGAFAFGDVFFDTNGSLSPAVRPSGDNGYFVESNPGFEYAIHFTGSIGNELQYDVYGLTPQSSMNSVFYNQNDFASPFTLRVDANSTLLASGTSLVTSITDAAAGAMFNTDIGTNGNGNGDNYLASFDVGFLGGKAFLVQVTQGCGNDLIVGTAAQITTTNALPETAPNALAMAGVAFSLFLFRRRR